MRVLVTGGRGMVGRKVVEQLLAAGHEVVATSRRPPQNETRPGVTWVTGDFNRPEWSNPDHWAGFLKQQGITHSIECAGLFEGSRQELRRLNHDMPLALAQAASRVGLERHIQITSLNACDVAGNVVWDDYRQLHQGLQKISSLDWVEVAPTHIYASVPGEAHIPYHLMAALPGHINFRPDTLMQPIHVNDLAAGIANLTTNGKASRQRLPAVGPDSLGHNQFLNQIQKAIGITGLDATVSLTPAMGRMLGRVNSLMNRLPFWNFIPAFTENTITFNSYHSSADHTHFQQAADLPRLRTIEQAFHADAAVNLEALGSLKRNNPLFDMLLPKVRDDWVTRFQMTGAKDWHTLRGGYVHLFYDDARAVPSGVRRAIQAVNSYYRKMGDYNDAIMETSATYGAIEGHYGFRMPTKAFELLSELLAENRHDRLDCDSILRDLTRAEAWLDKRMAKRY